MPEFRTGIYAIWAACVRVGIRPPSLPLSWDDCSSLQQALILAFDQIAAQDEFKQQALLAGAELK